MGIGAGRNEGSLEEWLAVMEVRDRWRAKRNGGGGEKGHRGGGGVEGGIGDG